MYLYASAKFVGTCSWCDVGYTGYTVLSECIDTILWGALLRIENISFLVVVQIALMTIVNVTTYNSGNG